jgi:hypothetical protein
MADAAIWAKNGLASVEKVTSTHCPDGTLWLLWS